MSAPAKAPSPHHARNEWATERHVYEPHLVGLPPVGQYLKEIWRRREFAFELANTKLRGQHFDTAFGQVWLVLNPLLLAGVYFILVDIIRAGNRPENFFAHLVAGIFAYYYVSGAIRDAAKSIVKGSKLILNSAFPRMLLPLSSVVLAFKRFLPTLLIYIPLHLYSDLPVGPELLWLLPLVLILTLIAIGFSLLVAAVQVYFRDLASFLPYALRVMLYASPVLYFVSEVPDRYRFLLDLNPMAQILSAWDAVIHFGTAPTAHSLLVASAWAIGSVVVGGLFFMSREREFAVRL